MLGFVLCVGTPLPANAQILRGSIPDTLPGAIVSSGELVLPGASGLVLPCITKALGIRIHWSSVPTVRGLKMLQDGELDLMYPMGFNAERDGVLQPSEPIFRSRDVWVYRGLRPRIEDKENVTVAAKSGSPQSDHLVREGYRHITFVTSYESLARMLESGRVQLIAAPGEGWDRLAPTLTWSAQSETYLTRDVGFYVSKTADPQWLKRLNHAILSCKAN